ncbi:MAG: penicillin acylase family protein, partial [Cryomorphaceae bacterium]
MKIFVRVLIIFGLLLLMAAIFGIYYVQRTAPQTDGNVELSAMDSDAEVYFDNFGIPHIYAETAEDAYRSLGYVHAQDRLFQMELVRRVGKGTLSEVLGADMIETDAFFRTLGTHRQAAQDAARFERLPDSLRTKVMAYLEGVNAFAEKGPLPIEFTLTQIEPETAVFAQCSAALQRPGLKFLEHLPVPMLQGSNAWAVAPSRSASGKALLANDTHIKYGSPSVWYEAHINYPGTELYGNFMAGIPFPLIGHTRRHAWGVTMFEDDDSDFFIQE